MQNGYRAIGGGKIFHERYTDPQSWNEYSPSKEHSKPPDPLPDHKPLNGMPGTANFDWVPFLIRSRKWAITTPHLPWYIPQKYFDLYPLDKITLPLVKDDDLDDIPLIGRAMAITKAHDHERVLTYKQWHTGVRSYLAAITFADA